MASPGNRGKGKSEAVEKQLLQWKERAQVWNKEKLALERKLGKQTFEPSLKETEDDFTRKAKDLLILRQESRLKEQTVLISQLQAQLADFASSQEPASLKGRIEELRTVNAQLRDRVKALEAEVSELKRAISIPATGATTPEDPVRISDSKTCNYSEYSDKPCICTQGGATKADFRCKLSQIEAERTILTEALSRTQSNEITLRSKLAELDHAFLLQEKEATRFKAQAEKLAADLEALQAVHHLTVRDKETLAAQVQSLSMERDREAEAAKRLRGELELVSTEMADLKQVLEASDIVGLEQVDVRGLARVLLSSVLSKQSKFEAFLAYVGPNFAQITTQFDLQLRQQDEKFQQLKRSYENQLEALQLRLDAYQIRAVRPKAAKRREKIEGCELMVKNI